MLCVINGLVVIFKILCKKSVILLIGHQAILKQSAVATLTNA